jgi:hypothetical protein
MTLFLLINYRIYERKRRSNYTLSQSWEKNMKRKKLTAQNMKNTQNQFFNIIYDTDKNWMIKNLIIKNEIGLRHGFLSWNFLMTKTVDFLSKFPKFKVFILGKFPISNFY